MHKLFSTYLSNSEFREFCSDEQFLAKMIRVEVALAQAQAEEGIIPKEAANAIEKLLPELKFNIEDLAENTAKNGIPTIGFLAQAKQELPKEYAGFLHWGVTSQDISDAALALILKEVSTAVKVEIQCIIKAFEILKEKHQGVQLAARTRNQMAVPVPFSLKVDSWLNPLKRQLKQWESLSEDVFCLQLAGADGQLGILGDKAKNVRNKVAKKLQLTPAAVWHNQRDRLSNFSDILSTVAASLGKFGQDVLALSQTEVGEVKEGVKGGGSSSMPHKNNPISSEALVALSLVTIDFASGIKRAQIHKNERDGVALAIEWLVWPKFIETIGACLQKAKQIAIDLQVDAERMIGNIETQSGLLQSEKATYVLAAHLGRDQAKQKVAKAAQLVQQQGVSIADALQQLTSEFNIDWKSVLQ